MCTEPGPDKPTRDTWLGRCHGALRSPGRTWPVSALCIKLSPCPPPGTRLEETKRGHFSKDVNSTRLHNRAGDRPQGSWPPPCAQGGPALGHSQESRSIPCLKGAGRGDLGWRQATHRALGSQGRASDIRSNWRIPHGDLGTGHVPLGPSRTDWWLGPPFATLKPCGLSEAASSSPGPTSVGFPSGSAAAGPGRRSAGSPPQPRAVERLLGQRRTKYATVVPQDQNGAEIPVT